MGGELVKQMRETWAQPTLATDFDQALPMRRAAENHAGGGGRWMGWGGGGGEAKRTPFFSKGKQRNHRKPLKTRKMWEFHDSEPKTRSVSSCRLVCFFGVSQE